MAAKIPISGCRTTKIYCRPGCPPGRRTLPKNRVYFKSRKSAIDAGYRACKVCKPDDSADDTYYMSEIKTPLGPYTLVDSKWGIVCFKNNERLGFFTNRWKKENITIKQKNEKNPKFEEQLSAYFDGGLHEFKIPLALHGTQFQRTVWNLLRTIPWGQTISYGQIAAQLGRPGSARAVGRAVGTNPVSIIVPCHRVIGSDGSLTGYGGGLDRKTALLRLEGIIPA